MLKTTKEFDFVYKNSYKFRTEMLDICVLKPNLAEQFFARFRRLPCNVVGFSVSKKVGIAVERNLVKRRLRAICREFFGLGNSSLGASFALGENFGEQQTPSLVLSPKFSPNTKLPPQILELDSNADSAESSLRENERSEFSWQSNQNQNARSATKSRPIRGAKNRIQGRSSASADFLLESDKRGSPPKSEKRQLLARRGSGAGGAALLREKTSKSNGKSVDCFGDESPRNDNMGQNLICIFIAKRQILQTPFATLKDSIFATLKRQLNFKKKSHTSPRNFSANRPQTKAKQNENR